MVVEKTWMRIRIGIYNCASLWPITEWRKWGSWDSWKVYLYVQRVVYIQLTCVQTWHGSFLFPSNFLIPSQMNQGNWSVSVGCVRVYLCMERRHSDETTYCWLCGFVWAGHVLLPILNFSKGWLEMWNYKCCSQIFPHARDVCNLKTHVFYSRILLKH